jgi:hypothetical protein
MSLQVSVAELAVQLQASEALADELRGVLGPWVEERQGPAMATLTALQGARPTRAPDVSRDDLQLWVEGGALGFAPGPRGSGWLGAAERALRFIYATWMPRHDGLLLHASCVAAQPGAVAFAGGSGAGKSTVARQFAAHDWMGDDTVALRRHEGRWFAYATPFVNTGTGLPRPRRAPLWRIFLLQRAVREQRVSVSPLRSLSGLLPNLMAPLPGVSMEAAMELAAQLSRRVEISELHRTRDGSIAGCLDASDAAVGG